MYDDGDIKKNFRSICVYSLSLCMPFGLNFFWGIYIQIGERKEEKKKLHEKKTRENLLPTFSGFEVYSAVFSFRLVY